MFQTQLQHLDFVGGPLDGLQEDFVVPLESVLAVKTIPLPQYWINELVTEKFHGDKVPDLQVGGAFEAFMVAIYELRLCDEQLRYYHVKSCVAVEQQLKGSRNWLLFIESRCIPKS